MTSKLWCYPRLLGNFIFYLLYTAYLQPTCSYMSKKRVSLPLSIISSPEATTQDTEHTIHTRYFLVYISICSMYIYRSKKIESRACIILEIYLFTSMYPYLSIRSSSFIIFCAKLSHKLVKNFILWIIFPHYVHPPKLSMSDVILKQVWQVFSPSLKFWVENTAYISLKMFYQ